MPRPSFEALGANWKNSDLPLAEKVRLTLKNNLIKIKSGSECCGNHGEPGC